MNEHRHFKAFVYQFYMQKYVCKCIFKPRLFVLLLNLNGKTITIKILPFLSIINYLYGYTLPFVCIFSQYNMHIELNMNFNNNITYDCTFYVHIPHIRV